MVAPFQQKLARYANRQSLRPEKLRWTMPAPTREQPLAGSEVRF